MPDRHNASMVDKTSNQIAGLASEVERLTIAGTTAVPVDGKTPPDLTGGAATQYCKSHRPVLSDVA
jgi:hypothetical protein